MGPTLEGLDGSKPSQPGSAGNRTGPRGISIALSMRATVMSTENTNIWHMFTFLTHLEVGVLDVWGV